MVAPGANLYGNLCGRSSNRTHAHHIGRHQAILYLVSNAEAFVLGADASISSGLLEAQSGSPLVNTSLKGNYLGDTLPWPDLKVVSLVAVDGAGNPQFTSDRHPSDTFG